MEACLLVILVTISGVLPDSIGPKDKEAIISKEGESVTLNCTYSTTSNEILLYWFRQNRNTEPQYLLYKGARSWSREENIPDRQRFQSTTSQTSTELTIRSVTLSDSALYYCALRVAAQ
ncbi:hypothetical protein F2P79_019572 [Pimephales promelas]|nr:hypothetical protein F2P79_019572 [Pimephales promelas]